MGERICKNCRFWDSWLADHGDCLEYAERRREIMLTATDDTEVPPQKPAKETGATDTCERFDTNAGGDQI